MTRRYTTAAIRTAAKTEHAAGLSAYKRFRAQQVADTGIATARPDLCVDGDEPYVCVACPDVMVTEPEQHEHFHHDGAQTCWPAIAHMPKGWRPRGADSE